MLTIDRIYLAITETSGRYASSVSRRLENACFTDFIQLMWLYISSHGTQILRNQSETPKEKDSFQTDWSYTSPLLTIAQCGKRIRLCGNDYSFRFLTGITLVIALSETKLLDLDCELWVITIREERIGKTPDTTKKNIFRNDGRNHGRELVTASCNSWLLFLWTEESKNTALDGTQYSCTHNVLYFCMHVFVRFKDWKSRAPKDGINLF